MGVPLPRNESPTVSVFLQVLAPLPESSEAHRGQVLPPEQEHDYATNHEALPVARGRCQPGPQAAELLLAEPGARLGTETQPFWPRSGPLPAEPGFLSSAK